MEPAGFAVGLSGLVGVFTSCLEIVQRYDTYKTASRDKGSLDVQLQGAIYRLKHWGISVGIKDGKLSDIHHPALDNTETITLVNALLRNIKEFLDSPNDLDGPNGIQNMPSSGPEKLPRLERVAWALSGRFRQTNHVQALEPLVSLLYEVVPPESAKPLSRTNSLHHALDTGLNLNSNSTTHSYTDELRALVQRLKEDSKARTIRDLGTWLGAPPPNDIYHDSSEKRLENTCEWILHRDVFLQWQVPATTAKVLWIKGPAGFGKTVLCAKLVQEIERTTMAPLAYFFLSTKFEGRENPFLAMRSWLTSLVLKNQVAFDIVSKRRLSQHGQEAPQSTIVQLFGEVTMAIPGCIFVLDGLDECTGMADTDTKSVSHFLNELRKTITKTNTGLLILSRPAAVIQQGLSLFPGYSIYDIELDDVGPDLTVFASDVVKRKLTTKDEVWKFLITQKIKKRCQGQFQWVKLQEGSLRTGLSKKRLERVIDETPSGLDALYDREWDRINSMGSEDKQRALSLLRWAAFALHPLTVGQIAEAVLITEDCEELPIDERPDCIDEDYIESMILDLCGSLIEVKQPAVYNKNEDIGSPRNGVDDLAETAQHKQVKSGSLPRDREVHLTHFSVKEYICLKFSPPGVLLPDKKFRSFIESQEHMIIAKCCLRYISFIDVWDELRQRDDSRKFVDYAAIKWNYHYRQVGTPDSDLKESIWTLFDAGIETKNPWIFWAEAVVGLPVSQGGIPKEPRPLHVAASLGLTNIVRRLLYEADLDPNEPAGNGFTALHLACILDRKETAKLLLDNGADLGAKDENGLTALHVASMLEHRELVTLLIERGADVDARNNFNITPLQYASSQQQKDITRLFLDVGADLYCANTDGETPFLIATSTNRNDTVRLFLDKRLYNRKNTNAEETDWVLLYV
ncbi:Ff.00g007020.m01.CDS01 [Fusarium sp. VM40]|nr:Ff.00g007020.m01.CDS01 [Fusarium sp. VM40]